MKSVLFILCLVLLSLACKNEEKKMEKPLRTQESPSKEMAFESFGENISKEKAMDAQTIAAKYKNLKPGDTITASFTSTVNSVCKKKGCWMNVELPDGEVNVKFKEYAFFVPKDIEGREVVIKGKAFIEEVSVEDQKHYAKDAGKSEEEIAAINQPKKEYSFMADGVLLKK